MNFLRWLNDQMESGSYSPPSTQVHGQCLVMFFCVHYVFRDNLLYKRVGWYFIKYLQNICLYALMLDEKHIRRQRNVNEQTFVIKLCFCENVIFSFV